MITAGQAAEVFAAHAAEIVRECRQAPRGFRVLAEVDGDGEWRGAGRVTPGTGSLLAYEGRGFALYAEPNRFSSYADIGDAIAEWLEQQAERAN